MQSYIQFYYESSQKGLFTRICFTKNISWKLKNLSFSGSVDCSPDRGPSVLSQKKMTMKFRLTLILERDCQARKQKPCRDLRTTDISDLHIRPVQTLINFNISLPSAPSVYTELGLTDITRFSHFSHFFFSFFSDLLVRKVIYMNTRYVIMLCSGSGGWLRLARSTY